MKPVSCPNNGCRMEMQRQQVSEHVSACPHTVIPCKYKGIGCAKKMKRKDTAAHEQDDRVHLHMALETVASHEARLSSLLWEKPRLFVLSKCCKKMETGEQYQFPPFYTHPNGYHMALTVLVNGHNGTHVSVYYCLLEGEHDAELKWPFIGEVMFTLLNQLEDGNHYTCWLRLVSRSIYPSLCTSP
jgi:hypothetical protein